MLDFGWSKDWLDEKKDFYRDEVNESFIKCFVNRYFDYPADWNEDDIPLIMIFVKCRFCKNVQQHYIRESLANFLYSWSSWLFYYRIDKENFVYNWDNTYTSFSPNLCCDHCFLKWNAVLESYWSEDLPVVDEDGEEGVFCQFESPLEKAFWRTWKSVCSISLTPQYAVGNYRIDFAHIPSKTAIELDGKYHQMPDQVIRDKIRQQKLEKQGWHIIRFTYWDIMGETDDWIVEILNFISRTNEANAL